jgi:hypothetical protein
MKTSGLLHECAVTHEQIDRSNNIREAEKATIDSPTREYSRPLKTFYSAGTHMQPDNFGRRLSAFPRVQDSSLSATVGYFAKGMKCPTASSRMTVSADPKDLLSRSVGDARSAECAGTRLRGNRILGFQNGPKKCLDSSNPLKLV